jgi:hypothetical protein
MIREYAHCYQTGRQSPMSPVLADERRCSDHNAGNESAHARKQHRIYDDPDHVPSPTMQPLARVAQLHNLVER